jgi:PKD repeat protein
VNVAGGTNQPPFANYRYACSGLACTFTDNSYDSDGSLVSHQWTFGDGATSNSVSPSHTFASPGTYTVALAVTDDNGATYWKSNPVQVATALTNSAPYGSFTFPCTGLVCTFNDFSNDLDGSVVLRRWDFGDGASSSTANATHTYPAPGLYFVMQTVVDNDGAEMARTREVIVTGPANTPPTAAFTFSCTALACTFTDASTDADGTVSAWSWSFGDGATATTKNASHSYAAAGTYSVKLTVTDNGGLGASQTQSVTVAASPPPPPPSNQPPNAQFVSSCSLRMCGFDDTSTDSDGTIVSRVWDFGDGRGGSGKTPQHTYAAGGSYPVRVTVTDDDGASIVRTTTVSVSGSSANIPPMPNFVRPCTSRTCSFTDRTSDSDGTVVSMLWDFGDGATSTSSSPTHTYAADGTFMATLRITDDAGATQWTSMPVLVANGRASLPPFGSYTFPCAGLVCTFTDFTNDPDGSVVTWRWEFGDGTTSTQRNVVHTYPYAGSFHVRLTVTDNDGNVHTRIRRVVTN